MISPPVEENANIIQRYRDVPSDFTLYPPSFVLHYVKCIIIENAIGTPFYLYSIACYFVLASLTWNRVEVAIPGIYNFWGFTNITLNQRAADFNR